MKRPDFFIVGAPKCGTTSLCRYLDAHPDIFISKPKEPKFFCSDLNNSNLISNLTMNQYLNLFSNAKDKICGEGSPWYLVSKIAPKKIYEFNPNAKIIIMLREPVSLLYSLHGQRLVALTEDIEDFQLALEADADRRLGKNLPKTANIPVVYTYSDIVKYTEQVQRYFNIFGKSNVKVIIFDDFIEDTSKIYQEVLDFLGVNSLFFPEFIKHNSNKKITNTHIYRLILSPLPFLFKIGNAVTPKFLRPIRRKIAWTIIKGTLGLITKTNRRPPLDPQIKIKLQQNFLSEISSLSILLEKDLSNWIAQKK
jgi:hypothetical protein